jgi:GAF domain-containing protein/multidrug resistance efflux pump
MRTGPPMDRKAAFLNEIKRLTLQAAVDPDTFFRAFFERVGAIIEAQGGSMWFHEKASDKLHCRVDSKPREFASTTPENEAIQKAVLNAIKTDNSILVAPDQADSALVKALGKESGSDVLSAMCVPYEIDQESSGALFFYTDGVHRRFDTTDVYLVKQLATYVRAYCLNWKCQQLQARTAKLDALTKLSADLHASLNPEEIAFTIVNMPPELLTHDRCSLALMKGERSRMAAISGQDMVQHRSALVKLLTEIANWVAKKGEVTVITRQSLDATEDQHFKTLVERYYQDTNMEILLCLPIKEEKRTLGVLTFERRNGAPFTGQDLAMVQILTNQVRVALNNARRYHALPMVSTLEQIAGAKEKVMGKQRVKTAIKWGIVAFLLFVLAFVKYPFRVHVPCMVMTKEFRNVTVRVDGTIKQVFHDEGDIVNPDEVIAKMDDTQLKVQLIQRESELQRTRREYDKAVGESRVADANIIKDQMAVIQSAIDELNIKIKETHLVSGIKGTILTPRLRQKKDQSMRQGEVFCQVALLDPMSLELAVPEDDAGLVKVGQPVRYIINAMPDKEFEGKVEKVGQESVQVDQINCFVVTMDVKNSDGSFSKGMRGTASVEVGREVVGYILFRKIWSFIRIRVLF